ncbi:hypothetical protein RDWZM_008721 [Blomia tropicalis]|uniref:GPI alpha-1,4-mannosyltransferase I, catalytic subunit n=1 Tax=Blomia tropicalis TaxID=40697 RepID=A0A9Q0M283_BLOTA|nr:hypothetical protein RDWZM_008721 [Blomia tropicalis]
MLWDATIITVHDKQRPVQIYVKISIANNSTMSLLNQFLKKKIGFHLRFSSFIHIFLIIFCEIQDRILDVKYTDIDYVIFTDGARFTLDGGSPFDRETYRYTPLLAWIMTPNIIAFPQFGKILFSALDILTGWMLYRMLPSSVDRKLFSLIWLYNPLTLIISTRGSSESIICSLVILALYLFSKKQYLIAGLVYGFVIHFKIYPVIYAPSLYLVISNKKHWRNLLPTKSKLVFFISTAVGFLIPTLLSFYLYGQIYIDEAWLYHFYKLKSVLSSNSFSVCFCPTICVDTRQRFLLLVR